VRRGERCLHDRLGRVRWSVCRKRSWSGSHSLDDALLEELRWWGWSRGVLRKRSVLWRVLHCNRGRGYGLYSVRLRSDRLDYMSLRLEVGHWSRRDCFDNWSDCLHSHCWCLPIDHCVEAVDGVCGVSHSSDGTVRFD